MKCKIVGDTELTQGEDFELKLRVIDEPSGDPHSFGNSFAGATAFFGNTTADADPVAVIGTNPETNVLLFQLAPGDTGALAVGEPIDFELQWLEGSSRRIEKVEQQLNVFAQLF